MCRSCGTYEYVLVCGTSPHVYSERNVIPNTAVIDPFHPLSFIKKAIVIIFIYTSFSVDCLSVSLKAAYLAMVRALLKNH